MAPERLPDASEAGSVVLDIGGDRGAAIVVVPATLHGSEIEIRASGAPWDGSHVAVLERRVPAGPINAAVFGPLPEGAYEIRLRSTPGAPVVPIHVVGAKVTRVDVRAGGSASLTAPEPGPEAAGTERSREAASA